MNQWSLLFVAPLLAYGSQWAGGYGFSANYLLVPLAALLGSRYVLTGVIFVAFGGLAFVVNVGGTWGEIGGNPALYLIALAVAAIAASTRPLAEWQRWPADERMAGWVAFAAPFVLALEAGTAYMRLPDTGLWFAFRFPFAPLGYFVLFAMGARAVRLRWPFAGLIAAAALTWWLARNGLLGGSSRVAFFVTVEALRPATALAALAAFWAGGAMKSLLHGGDMPAFWRRPAAVVAVLVLLWFVPEMTGSVQAKLAGAAAVLSLAAFMAGLLRGARGVVLVSALVPALMLLWVAAAWLLPEFFARNFRSVRLPLEAPFVTAAWAVLGAKLGQMRSGAPRFRLPRYPAYAVLFVVAAPALFGGGGPGRLAAAGLFVACGLAIYFAGERLGRAMARSGFAITAERWVSFTALALLAASVLSNLQVIIATLRQYYYRFPLLHAIRDPVDAATVKNFLGASINAELAVLLVAFAAIYALALASLLAGLASSVPKVWRDAGRIAGFVRQRGHA